MNQKNKLESGLKKYDEKGKRYRWLRIAILFLLYNNLGQLGQGDWILISIMIQLKFFSLMDNFSFL